MKDRTANRGLAALFEFIGRSLECARKMGRGEELPSEHHDVRGFHPIRSGCSQQSECHLLHAVRTKCAPVSDLAGGTQEGPESSEAGCFTFGIPHREWSSRDGHGQALLSIAINSIIRFNILQLASPTGWVHADCCGQTAGSY